MRHLKKSGFTLIELLIVIAIIGVLTSIVTVSLGSAKDKAKDGSFKTTARSVFSAAMTCCLKDAGSLNDVAGSEICAPGIGSLYPDSTRMGSITVDQDCLGDGVFQLTVTPGSANTGNCTAAVINEQGVDSFTGC